jgi:hypothetical protein
MTNIRFTDSEVLRTGNYADSSICSYLYYTCTYCLEEFMLIDPERNFKAGGAIRHTLYRNPDTGEVGAAENRSEGVCRTCLTDIMRRQQE